MVLHEQETEACTPRSSIPTTLNIVPATNAGLSSSAETQTSDSGGDQMQYSETEAIEGKIRTNLGDDIPLNLVVSTRVNKNHPIENIIGNP